MSIETVTQVLLSVAALILTGLGVWLGNNYRRLMSLKLSQTRLDGDPKENGPLT